jgi:hypothetical protein
MTALSQSNKADRRLSNAPASAYTASGSSPPPMFAGQIKPRFGRISLNPATAAKGEQFLHAKFNETVKKEPVTLKTLVGPTAISQALTDIVGVWMPKLVVLRSPFQFFEETFLEFVEDLAFYFSSAVAGFGLHKLMAKLAGFKLSKNAEKLNSQREAIGLGTPGKTDKGSKELIATKFGTLLGALALGGGFEFMIQHTKNIVTATQFHARNFTAIAGLEGAQDKAAKGEEDPVDKAKRRAKQVGLAVLGGLGAALLAPLAITRSKMLENGARKFLSYIDFSSGKAFDLSKPILGVLALIGAVSYIDASRDSLERKENATRLAVVIPYMIFGKEMIGYLMAKFHEKFGTVNVDGKDFKIGDLKKELGFSFLKDENPLKRAFKAEMFLNMQVQRDLNEFNAHFDEVTQKVRQNKPEMNLFLDKLKVALASHTGGSASSAFYLSAALTGILINLIAYAMTRERFKHQQGGKPPSADVLVPPQSYTPAANGDADSSQNTNASQSSGLPGQTGAYYPVPAGFMSANGSTTFPTQTFSQPQPNNPQFRKNNATAAY